MRYIDWITNKVKHLQEVCKELECNLTDLEKVRLSERYVLTGEENIGVQIDISIFTPRDDGTAQDEEITDKLN